MEQFSLLQQSKLKTSLQILQAAHSMYSPSLIFAFNGGKDSTVLLQLIQQSNLKIPIVYFQQKDPFPEIKDFIQTRLNQTILQVIRLGPNIKQQLETLRQKGYQAVILGQRITDSGCPTQLFSPTSSQYPPFIRINPLLFWTYHDIWTYLLHTKATFCSLYNRGYSSIGSRSQTDPNPLLKGAPAWELNLASTERSGRHPKL